MTDKERMLLIQMSALVLLTTNKLYDLANVHTLPAEPDIETRRAFEISNLIIDLGVDIIGGEKQNG